MFTYRNANICKTWAIFTLFFVAVIGIGWVFARTYASPEVLVFAVLLSSAMSVVSYWYSDKIVLAMAHARPAARESAPELYAIVEQLAKTAGLPTPKIYIIQEDAPNAFATGRNPQHAVVAVTEGLLRRLDRLELEGVLSHELSHIGNRDILVSTVVVILVGFISILGDMFLRSALWGGMRRRDDRDSGANGIVLLIGIVLSMLAPIAAMLMQLAIARKREFLADASGALLTRYPEGLASALIKIHNDATPLRAAQNTTAHLWIDDPFTKTRRVLWFHKLFMTHPPVEERVKALRGMKM